MTCQGRYKQVVPSRTGVGYKISQMLKIAVSPILPYTAQHSLLLNPSVGQSYGGFRDAVEESCVRDTPLHWVEVLVVVGIFTIECEGLDLE